MAYITNTEYKTWKGITVATHDTLITTLISRAQAMLERDLRRIFEASSDETRHFHVQDYTVGRTLYLDRDLATITSITNGNGDSITSSDYTTFPRNYSDDNVPIAEIILLGNSGVSWQIGDDFDEDQIAIVGKWAYSTSAPDDVKAAMLELTDWLWQRKDHALELDRGIQTEDGIILPASVPLSVRALRKQYRRPTVKV